MIGHIPVLLNEVTEYLDPKPGQKFIDATINGGGHALAIVEKIKPNGKLLGIEWDRQIYQNLKIKNQNSEDGGSIVLVNDSYVNLQKIARENNFEESDGVLFDLGMSSWHIEESGRGFSFQKDELLDMRYDSGYVDMSISSETAADILNKWRINDIERILNEYGEERFFRNIARAIIEERKNKPIISTFQLVEVIKNSVPFWYRRRKIHFATRTFQALRIAVNHELENVQKGIEQAEKTIKKGGRIAVITFHSLEDRIVKNLFRDGAKEGRFKLLTKKPIIAGLPEITANPRARSAKLRVVIKN